MPSSIIAAAAAGRYVGCPQCEMISINGVACHERGCPNMGARWDADSESWVKQRVCFECGCAVDTGSECCAAEEFSS